MDDAEDQRAVELEADQGGEEGQPGDEVLGGVDGIDDPAVALAPLLAEFLAEEPQLRRRAMERLADRLLGSAVRHGDRRGVALHLHA